MLHTKFTLHHKDAFRLLLKELKLIPKKKSNTHLIKDLYRFSPNQPLIRLIKFLIVTSH